MKRIPSILIGALVACSGLAVGAEPERTGKQVVEEQCAACHASGKDGAPKIGDKAAWAPRASRGLSSLGRNALDGVRKMPAHGGKLALSDLEIQRAVTYMVNQSGGNWAEPIDRRKLPAARPADQLVKQHCAACHAEGTHGAPRIGDKEAWIARAKPGFEGLVRSAIQGHGGMPSRGGMANLTDDEVKAAVTYMFQVSTRNK